MVEPIDRHLTLAGPPHHLNTDTSTDVLRVLSPYLKSARGDGSAAFRIGEFYDQGRNAPRSGSLAWAWFSIAAENGNPEAPGKLSTLAGQMNEAEMQQARQRLATLQADLKEIINNYIISTFKDALKEKLSLETQQLEEQANKLLQRADAAGMHAQVKKLLASLSSFWEELKVRVEAYAALKEAGNFSLGTLLEKITADLAQLQLNFNGITDDINQLQTAITNAVPAVRAGPGPPPGPCRARRATRRRGSRRPCTRPSRRSTP